MGVTLYAQWEPIAYSISYTLGAGGAGGNNSTSYTIETGDVVLNAPGTIHAGYQFLGWFSGDTQVKAITKGSTGNVELTAKWGHSGVFSLSYVGTSGSTSTYRITRTIPAGAVPNPNPQYVYYRTVNGTAIGGTAEAVHFNHVGGENVYKTFMKVTDNTDYNSNTSHVFDMKDYRVSASDLSYDQLRLFFIGTTNNTDRLYAGFTMNMREAYDGYQCLSVREMNDDSVMYISYAEIEHGGSGTDKNWADWSADLNPLPPLSTKGLRSVYDAWGSGSDDWWVRNVRFNVRVIDTKEPAQIGLAPMAEGQYRRGDTITLSVVYDEIVANRNNASLGSISGLSLANVTYRGGRGHHMLTFTATVNQDSYEVDSSALMAQKPIGQTVYDMAS